MDRKQLVIGLPAAGKTTFLAALWHVLESGQVPGALRLSEVHGDQGYLNRIRDAWGSCQPIERTRRGQETVVRMRLVEADGSAATELIVPDPSGESFTDQWELGRASGDYLALAQGALGVLLFINPLTLDNAPVIEGPPVDGVGGGTARAWQPRVVGTQVQLVEMLQAPAVRPSRSSAAPCPSSSRRGTARPIITYRRTTGLPTRCHCCISISGRTRTGSRAACSASARKVGISTRNEPSCSRRSNHGSAS